MAEDSAPHRQWPGGDVCVQCRRPWPCPDAPPADVQVFRGEQIQQVTWVDSFGWTCERCGWLGLGLLSVEAAMQEAHDHIKRHHPEMEKAEVVLRG